METATLQTDTIALERHVTAVEFGKSSLQ